MTGKECSGCRIEKPDVMTRQVGTSAPLLCADCADQRRALARQGQSLASEPPRGLE